MCSIFEEVRQEGLIRGRLEGREEGRADLLKALRAAGADGEILKRAAEQAAA